MNVRSAVLTFSVILLAHIAAGKDPDYQIPKVVAKVGKYGEPGASARITSIGLAYLREIGMSLLNKKIRQLEFKDKITSKSPVGIGRIEIENIKIIDYWPPESYDLELVPKHQFAWIMRGLGVRAAGQFKTDITLDAPNAKPIRAAGDWDILIDYMDFDMTIELGIDGKGYPTVKAKDCNVVVHGLDLQIQNAGILTTVMDFLRGMISNQVKPQIATQICAKASAMVNSKANEMLSSLPLKKSIAELTKNFGRGGNSGRTTTRRPSTRRRGKRAVDIKLSGDTVKDLVDKIRNKNLIVDLTLTERPLTSRRGNAQTKHQGEIAWKNEATPFHAAPMKFVDAPGKQMLQLFVSDYVINSLLYAVHKHQLMDFVLKADSSPDLATKLTTTCEDVCLGDLIYPLADEYPDHYIDIALKTLKMPTVIFMDKKAAVLIAGQADMIVRNKRSNKATRVVESELNLAAFLAAQFDPTGQKLKGAVQVERLTLKLLDTKVDGVDQDTLDLLAEIVKELVDAGVNGALRKGIDVPKMDGMQMISPTMSFMPNQLVLDTYFKIDEDFLEKLIPS